MAEVEPDEDVCIDCGAGCCELGPTAAAELVSQRRTECAGTAVDFEMFTWNFEAATL